VKPSLRQLLADSHVAAVAIAVLLLWSFQWGVRALWDPVSSVTVFLFTAVAILDVPYLSLTASDWLALIGTFTYLVYALISFAIAWLLSRWVYGNGPFHSLSMYRMRLGRSNHV